MTLVVRDEEDVIEPNLRYHLAQGVDFVIATDNGSTDGTLEVLHRYAGAGLLHLIEERSDDYHELQAEWITRMARLAATDFGADWVINNDADEFWWPVSGTLADAFSSVEERWTRWPLRVRNSCPVRTAPARSPSGWSSARLARTPPPSWPTARSRTSTFSSGATG